MRCFVKHRTIRRSPLGQVFAFGSFRSVPFRTFANANEADASADIRHTVRPTRQVRSIEERPHYFFRYEILVRPMVPLNAKGAWSK
jgi:hypothetical protein